MNKTELVMGTSMVDGTFLRKISSQLMTAIVFRTELVVNRIPGDKLLTAMEMASKVQLHGGEFLGMMTVHRNGMVVNKGLLTLLVFKFETAIDLAVSLEVMSKLYPMLIYSQFYFESTHSGGSPTTPGFKKGNAVRISVGGDTFDLHYGLDKGLDAYQ